MEKLDFNIITLNWIKADFKEFPDESGVYQIYGTSPLYGMDTLLYIGQAKNLRNRVKDHFDVTDSTIGRQPNKSCRYATLPSDLLNIVEQTLIVMYKPSFNSARIIQVSPEVKARAFYIQNHGERGMLNIENTNFYFLNKPNKEIPFDIILPDDNE